MSLDLFFVKYYIYIYISYLILQPGEGVINDIESVSDINDLAQEKSMIVSLSPDDGAFLASQPVPHHGSFCYLAITTKKRDT